MAKKEKLPASPKGKGLVDLIGNAATITLPDGSSVIVPAGKSGNRVANMIVAAEVRHLLQNSIKRYRDQEMLPTPKDLKDLAEAAASLARFSGDVYKEEEADILPSEPKKDAKPAAPSEDVSFDAALEAEAAPKK